MAEVTISVGEGVVVVRRRGRPAVTASILGMELGADGNASVLWLDRLVHREDDEYSGGWVASGAISTILSRIYPVPSA